MARSEETDAVDETVLAEAMLVTEGVGDELRSLRDELGDVGKRPNGEKRRLMLSSGDSRGRWVGVRRVVGGDGAGRGA